MSSRTLELPSDPDQALAALRDASGTRDVVVFKRSPTCPISHRAEAEFRAWVGTLDESDPTGVAVIDVIGERALARGLTALLDVVHESPQALWFSSGELRWHDSHGALTRARFERGAAPE